MDRLFVTQELVMAVCAHLHAEYLSERDADSNEFQRVASVSTYFFYGMLPYIWKSVALSDLSRRMLIPATLTRRYSQRRSTVDEGQFQLMSPYHHPESSNAHVPQRVSGPVSRETMSRFHFYAPYIKVLQVPLGSTDAAETDNWKPLAEYSKDNELLPNLVELECRGFNPQALSVFLRPSTQKLTIGPQESWNRLDIARSRHLLEHAAPQCPNLRSLEFYPEATRRDDIPTPPQTFTLLSSFKDLRRLVSTPVVIQSSALQLVAQLPHLSSLSIGPNAGGRHWDSSSCEPVPAGGFPALNDLTLCVKKAQDATRFWELLPLRMLKKLDLTIMMTEGAGSSFISTLCRASPQIAELGLKFDESARGCWSPYRISADIFEHLACLPIESSCSFDGVEFNFEGAWARVAGAWPNLRFIKCFTHPTDLKDLMFLSSHLLKLETIWCHFNLNRATGAIEHNWPPVGRPLFYPHLQRLLLDKPHIKNTMGYNPKAEGRTSGFKGLGRFLAYFWRKLKIKAIGEDLGGDHCDDYGRYYWQVNTDILVSQEVSVRLFKELVQTYVELYNKA